MKKILALFLTAVLMLSLCACGEGIEEGQVAQKPSVNIPEAGKKAPSEEMIMQDLGKELRLKNQYAKLTNVETIKSLTNESDYEITLSILAEAKYADWVYETKLKYTKYDQGWIMDDVIWISEKYTVCRKPTDQELSAKLNEMFAKDNIDTLHDLWFLVFPVETGSVIASDITSGRLRYEWVVTGEFLHAKYDVNVWSSWNYDNTADSWVLAESDTYGALEGKYAVFYEQSNADITANFTGKWESSEANGKAATISNFSKDGFDFEIGGEIEHFNRRLSEKSAVVFDGDSHRLYFLFSTDGTEIIRTEYYDDSKIDWKGHIQDRLPELTEG